MLFTFTAIRAKKYSMEFSSLQECISFIKTQPGNRIPELVTYAMENFDLYNEDEDAFFSLLANPACPSERMLDDLMTEAFFAKYEYYRAIGLSPVEAGMAQGVPSAKMNRILRGESVRSVSLYKRLCAIEISAPLQLKIKSLRTVDSNLDKESFSAAVTVLERRYKEEWGRNTESTITIANGPTSVDCETMARDAATRLTELRKQRKK